MIRAELRRQPRRVRRRAARRRTRTCRSRAACSATSCAARRCRRRSPGGTPTAAQIQTFYESYPDLSVRLVQSKPAPAWLGAKAKGFAISEVAPTAHLRRCAPARRSTVRTSEGSFRVKPLDDALPLGAVPLGKATPAIEAALRELRARRGVRAVDGRQAARRAEHGDLRDATTCRSRRGRPHVVPAVPPPRLADTAPDQAGARALSNQLSSWLAVVALRPSCAARRRPSRSAPCRLPSRGRAPRRRARRT